MLRAARSSAPAAATSSTRLALERTAGDPAEIERAVTPGASAGERYPEQGVQRLDRKRPVCRPVETPRDDASQGRRSPFVPERPDSTTGVQVQKRRLLIRFRAGPTWADRGPPQAQPGWKEHAAFIDRLVDAGTLVMGGPVSDHTGAMLLLEGVSGREANELFADDPFVRNGVFVLDEIVEWTIFVDVLRKPQSA